MKAKVKETLLSILILMGIMLSQKLAKFLFVLFKIFEIKIKKGVLLSIDKYNFVSVTNNNKFTIGSLYTIIFLLFILIKKMKSKSTNSFINIKNINIKNVILAIAIGLSSSFFITGFENVIQNIDHVQLIDNLPIIIITFNYVLYPIILGPLFEEIIFRGIIYNHLKSAYSIKCSIILQSILFFIYHRRSISIKSVYILIVGIVFCYILYKTNSILYSFLAHSSYNFLQSIPFYASYNIPQKYILIIGLFLTCVLLYFLSWNNKQSSLLKKEKQNELF